MNLNSPKAGIAFGRLRLVLFNYNSWDPKWLYQKIDINSKAKPIDIYLSGYSKPIIQSTSLRETSKILGVSITLITPHHVHDGKSFVSPLLGMNVIIKEKGASFNNNKIIHRAKINHSLLDYDFDKIPKGKVLALLPDKITIFDSYSSSSNAAKILDKTKFKNVKKFNNKMADYIHRYLNLNKLVKTEMGEFYFVINPLTLIERAKRIKPKFAEGGHSLWQASPSLCN